MTMDYVRYDWAGGREWMLRTGPREGPQAMIVPPLFEEMNFLRALTVALARDLAGLGVGCWIVDLPGTGESARPLAETSLSDWRAGATAAAAAIAEAAGLPHVAALRGGALIDDAAQALSCWRFAPADGAGLLRQMERAQAIGEREAGRPAAAADAPTIDLIGYRIGRPLYDAVRAAAPATPPWPLREVPFAGPGAAPWRRAEPAPDAALSRALAEDLAVWIAACGG
ncbi:hypothetical protein [Sphingomonas profundi]|uniref:hypothetical protein n=1 Tax=Alterirhizorhabdus profundi TaxID=2681549 RepID=UPI0012E944F8|nr:hypothetical protein [Sphingomonas profundi]